MYQNSQYISVCSVPHEPIYVTRISRGRPGLGHGWLLTWMVALVFGMFPGQIRAQGTGGVTLFVLDFDNRQGDERLDWLSKALKDMVLLRMEEEPRIIAKDAGQIEPFLAARETRRNIPGYRSADANILLMGSYNREGSRILVDLQLLDMSDWASLGRSSVEALYGDIPQLNTLLVQRVRAMVEELSIFGDIGRESLTGGRPPPPRLSEAGQQDLGHSVEYSRQLPGLQEDLVRALDDLEAAMDTYAGYRPEPKPTVQSGDTYYREFDLKGTGAFPEERAQHTALFEDVLERVARNPYSADIGDLELKVDPYDNRVYINIPITYGIKQTLLEDMLYSLPYESTREIGRLRSIRYDRTRFNFSPDLIRSIARGDFRVVPVIQLLDRAGTIRAVIVDSPNMSWERYFPREGVRVIRQKGFGPLLAITTSGFSVDVRMETADVDVVYEFDVNIDQLSSYARVVVRFMKEDELHAFLLTL